MDIHGRGFDLATGKVVGRGPVGDGSFLETLHNFRRDERGLLSAGFQVMPLIPNAWRGAAQPDAFAAGATALIFWLRWGCQPELLVLTPNETCATWRYAPWSRAAGGVNPGLEYVSAYRLTSTDLIGAASALFQPPPFVALQDYVVFNLGDRGLSWIWDGDRLVQLGFTSQPAAPQAWGPQAAAGGNVNEAGFSVYGRVGSTDGSWLDAAGTGATVGGLKPFRRQYALVYRHVHGGYSAISVPSGPVACAAQVAGSSNDLPGLTRRFRVMLPTSLPNQTAAIILLATRNQEDAIDNASAFRYHSTYEHIDGPIEVIDDLPDSELGDIWPEREQEPTGVSVYAAFDGNLWRFAGATGYWSERTAFGPVYGSILKGHYITIYPETGDVVAALAAPWKSSNGWALMLVLKQGAAHYVTGNYPEYTDGTLHGRAGCYGPRLVQVLPDGAIMWVGSGTVWRYTLQEGVADVGAPIRPILRRINESKALFGQSWVDTKAGQAVFVVPIDDGDVSYQLIWDYELVGWRTAEDVHAITAATTLPDGHVLVSGVVDAVNTVYLYQCGYQSYAVTAATWSLRTAWIAQTPGSDMHRDGNIWGAVFICEERSNGMSYAQGYRDWNADSAFIGATNGLPVASHAPTDDTVPYYGTAVYDIDVWRTERTYRVQLPLDGTSGAVTQFAVSGTAPFAWWALHGFGKPAVWGPGSRVTPTSGGT